jgi:hypothetical protein
MSVFGRAREFRSYLIVAALLGVMPLFAAERPSITFENKSGDDASVRLDGPTSGRFQVSNSTSKTVEVAGGVYRMYVRYGGAGNYRYTRGDSFTVYEGPDGVDQITITLHKVVGGNYGTSPSSETEFNGGR